MFAEGCHKKAAMKKKEKTRGAVRDVLKHLLSASGTSVCAFGVKCIKRLRIFAFGIATGNGYFNRIASEPNAFL